MKIIDKVMEENMEENIEKNSKEYNIIAQEIINDLCPYDFGYSEKSSYSCSYGRKCQECWNREIEEELSNEKK